MEGLSKVTNKFLYCYEKSSNDYLYLRGTSLGKVICIFIYSKSSFIYVAVDQRSLG